MPISRPAESRRGPPEFPLLIEASVCMGGLVSDISVPVSDLNREG